MPAPDPDRTEPEALDGEMRPSDIVEILRGLHFGRGCRQRDAQRHCLASMPRCATILFAPCNAGFDLACR
jgi:hypothetical protein